MDEKNYEWSKKEKKQFGITGIFLNVIGNAIKYNKPGGTIRISAQVTEQDADYVSCRFKVADTGIGMSEEFQKHMFEQFTQEHEDGRTEYKGTGLGLAIVKRIVEKMGGEIRVNSKKDVGTEFIWTLTFATDKNFVEKVYVQEEGPDSHSDCMKRKKILIVEDNDMNLEIIQFMLEDWGAETVSARNGKEVLDSFRQSEQNEFDYIFMDIMMPVMDGLTATKEIRRLNRPDATTIPIIAMSANAFAEDVAKAKQAGVTEYLVKPLDLKKLKKILKN